LIFADFMAASTHSFRAPNSAMEFAANSLTVYSASAGACTVSAAAFFVAIGHTS